jgi:hypothetical protein
MFSIREDPAMNLIPLDLQCPKSTAVSGLRIGNTRSAADATTSDVVALRRSTPERVHHLLHHTGGNIAARHLAMHDGPE